MVAYGVLELKQPSVLQVIFLEENKQDQDVKRHNDDLRTLVSAELKRYGLMLSRKPVSNGGRWSTSKTTHCLYGQKQGSEGFKTRPLIHEGDFKECCVIAAKILDELDAAQVPDTATGVD